MTAPTMVINPLDAGTVADHDRQVADGAMMRFNPYHTVPVAPSTVDYLIREATLYGIMMERARGERAAARARAVVDAR